MSALYQVLYCSRNRMSGGSKLVSDNIETILATSRQNNARDQVTGGLIFSDGCFAQVLEGPMDAVVAAFERIQCDERHSEVIVLRSGPIQTRSFADWSMAFTGSSDTTLSSQLPISAVSEDGDAVLALLKSVVVRETEWLRRRVN
jgi:blue light- and temperature-responsive anti-repressor